MATVPTPLTPYLVWIKLAVVVAIVGSIFWAGWKVCDWRWESKENRERKDLIEKMDKERSEWEAERQRWELASQLTATQLSNLETQKDSLMATLNGLKLTRTITVKPDAQGNCVAAVLDDSFRLRWNTVVQQAASGVAADSGK